MVITLFCSNIHIGFYLLIMSCIMGFSCQPRNQDVSRCFARIFRPSSLVTGGRSWAVKVSAPVGIELVDEDEKRVNGPRRK
ncbi:hypothetical protein L6452_21699 [Arctium lappa]|uniref:Uncharacterized protein n=1 Tax=Arctium lappa TaxID=4217 RepID=A0ACB9AXR6_ARCLA|nr:hypothetical protein L6452_21699 [Arctium lappa]